MALFPMTQFDFPNCSAYDSDLRELLAMYEKLVAEYGLIIEALNTTHEEYESLLRDFAALKKEVDDFERVLDQKIDEGIAGAMESYIESVDLRIATINAKVDGLSDEIRAFSRIVDGIDFLIGAEVSAKIAPILVEIAEINRRIDEIILELPDVYNIVRGYETELVTLVYDIYDATRDHAYTALQFDTSGRTASKLDNMEYNAITWDVNGYSILYPCSYAINPFTGQSQELNAILEQIAQAATGDACITAGDYDLKELTADGFEAYQLTAQQYDFYSNNLLSA